MLGCRGVKLRFNNRFLQTLRVIGPSKGGVRTCIAGVRVLKIAILEGSEHALHMWKVSRKKPLAQFFQVEVPFGASNFGDFEARIPESDFETMILWCGMYLMY